MRLKSKVLVLIVTLVLFVWGNGGLLGGQSADAQKSIMPTEYFGFKPGTDRMLFDYEQLVGYLQKLDGLSDRVKMVDIGESPQGRRMYIAFISSEANIGNLGRLKEINRRLALDPGIPAAERETLVQEGRVFFLATLSMHSDEVGPSQAAPEIAYDLAFSKDPQKVSWLENVVYMMVPSHNPDGMDMVVHHYNKLKGTRHEGRPVPGVYHKYVGHDNNRDFVTLTQSDTRAIARIYNLDWFPQVMVEKHQMMSNTARYYVPPSHDPIAENVDADLWNWTGIFGAYMIKDMTAQGLSGVVQRYVFDNYWPGSTETCIWKNVIAFLTEGASALDATPVFIEPNELVAYGKGLSEYKKTANMPLPWPGGWWRLSDLVQYEISSTMSIIKAAAMNRSDILVFRNDLCRREVERGRTVPPFYYLLPQDQHDKSELVALVNLLKEHGVEVYRLAEAITCGERNYHAGDIVVPLAQPFRPFIKEVLEHQEYPVRRYTPGGEIIEPYDITSWCLPLHRGIKAVEIKERLTGLEAKLQKIDGVFSLAGSVPVGVRAAVFTVNANESYKVAFRALGLGLKVERLTKETVIDKVLVPAGSFVISRDNEAAFQKLVADLTVSPLFLTGPVSLETQAIKMPRLALVETPFHDMDAGWTRYLFDTYHIPYRLVVPADFAKTDFAANFDVVLFPDNSESLLMTGKFKYEGRYYISGYQPQYTKGIGKEGMERLMTFLTGGGIVVCWGESVDVFLTTLEMPLGGKEKEEIQLPVENVSAKLKKDGVKCPGTFMRATFLADHPLTLGMEEKSGIFFSNGPVFETLLPNTDMDRRVIAAFPEKKIALSGWCEKEEKLANRSLLVWVRKDKGQWVFFGFNPQFRASTQVTFKLLFNALLLPALK